MSISRIAPATIGNRHPYACLEATEQIFMGSIRLRYYCIGLAMSRGATKAGGENQSSRHFSSPLGQQVCSAIFVHAGLPLAPCIHVRMERGRSIGRHVGN
jgi:hypothetical protein